MNDLHGRKIDYLRLSVTEACNFRCAYCAPGGRASPISTPITIDEIEQLVRAAAALGIDKVRLTGGEPLMRREIVDIVHRISAVGVRDLSMTTNGFRLAELAEPLAHAGLDRVNVSLDTLRPDRFARITGRAAFERVWSGILAADAAGLGPIKLNAVALRGVNDDEVGEFARLTVEHPWHVRFIELMPVGSGNASQEFFNRHFIPANELAAKLVDLQPVHGPRGNGPVKAFRLPGAQGTIGFITPASDHFCSSCNRIRVTARGVVRPCLFGEEEIAIPDTGSRTTKRSMQELLAQAIQAKPEHHPWGSGFTIMKQGMSQIGG